MFWIRALSWFWRCNKHPCPLTSDLGFWRILEVPDCGLQSWSWFGWLLVFVTPMFQILAYSLPFKGSKNIHVLTGVWHLDFDLNMFTDLWYLNIPNFGSLSWFWRCKEHPCPLSPIYGLWLGLEVPDWGLASWSWFGYGHWSLSQPWSEFWFSILNLKMQRTSMSFKSWFGSLEDAGGSWWGLASWSWFGYGHWSSV